MKTPVTRLKSSAAFTLVEVALAMGLASFCLVAVLGLVPLGVDTSQVASDQTAAANILTSVVADLRATPMTSPPGVAVTSAEYALKIPDNATLNGTSPTPQYLYFGTAQQQFAPVVATSGDPKYAPADTRYRLTVTFLPSVSPLDTTRGATSGRAPTKVSLLVTWPATIDLARPETGPPAGRVQMFAALDRN